METSSFNIKLRESEHAEVIEYLKARGDKFFHYLKKANTLREEQVGSIVTFIRNQNINFSNICYVGCRFCGFSAHENDEQAFRMSLEDIMYQTRLAKERKVTEICATAGIDPKFRLQDYIQILKIFKREHPQVHVHAFSPFEVYSLARKEDLSYEDVLRELMVAGLNSLAGTAAEILVDDVRKMICPNKLTTKEWIEIIMLSHSLGLKTTSTMMYGHVETIHDIATHLQILKAIQEETNGFTEFIPLPFIHQKTRLFHEFHARAGSTGINDLSVLFTSRLYLGEIISNIQVSWVKTGVKFAQIGLLAGANDFGGTLFEERISKYAGGTNGTVLEEKEMIRVIRDAQRIPARRDTLYNILETYSSS